MNIFTFCLGVRLFDKKDFCFLRNLDSLCDSTTREKEVDTVPKGDSVDRSSVVSTMVFVKMVDETSRKKRDVVIEGLLQFNRHFKLYYKLPFV